MTDNITGKVIVITGASSGMGEATARDLAAKGAKVALGARRQDRLDTIGQEIEAAGGEAVALATDVTKREEVRRWSPRPRTRSAAWT
ncbi:short chain dehydrogenase [Palleronia pelagia]|uniref:Short chain dehydrogenase n=1 Tax=Palleronia pelagia TaxID=387096 RepID=A0A1H8FJN2_9RHOB|nr:short chain dehydrogenase [Palleronia pelagia]